MPFAAPDPRAARRRLRDGLTGDRLLRFPGSVDPLVARLIARQGWDGVYLSGGAFSASLGLPDVGLTTLSEVAERAARIARASDLPLIVDADTGFGEAINAARTVAALEAAGVAGCHLEDQQLPKRCGHLAHKTLVDAAEMEQKLRAAVAARRDPSFVLIARTDARAVEGFDAAVDRARRYRDAGADLIFPEALHGEAEFRAFRDAVEGPLMANMTEFGKSPLLSAQSLERFGYRLVIYPVTTLRLAMKAIEAGLERLMDDGHQRALLERMQTRDELYDLLDYAAFAAFDEGVAGFDAVDPPDPDPDTTR